LRLRKSAVWWRCSVAPKAQKCKQPPNRNSAPLPHLRGRGPGEHARQSRSRRCRREYGDVSQFRDSPRPDRPGDRISPGAARAHWQQLSRGPPLGECAAARGREPPGRFARDSRARIVSPEPYSVAATRAKLMPTSITDWIGYRVRRRCGGASTTPQQQGQSHDEKILRLSHLPCTRTCLLSLIGKLPEPESTHEFFLAIEKRRCLVDGQLHTLPV